MFAPIESQSTRADRRALLQLQRVVRQEGPYSYLEVGSHLGGSLQTHYIDPRCMHILSLDTRPLSQPDARGVPQPYPDNSSARMRAALEAAYPAVDRAKLAIVEDEAARAGMVRIDPPPLLCFIDGEHTRRAALADLAFCRSVAAPDAIFVFHDADLIGAAIGQIQWRLLIAGERWRGFSMGTSVFLIIIGTGVDRFAGALATLAVRQRPSYWISMAHRFARLRARHSRLWRTAHRVRRRPGQ